MKKVFLLQDIDTGKFLTDSGSWTSDETSALPYENETEAQNQTQFYKDDYGNEFVTVIDVEKWF